MLCMCVSVWSVCAQLRATKVRYWSTGPPKATNQMRPILRGHKRHLKVSQVSWTWTPHPGHHQPPTPYAYTDRLSICYVVQFASVCVCVSTCTTRPSLSVSAIHETLPTNGLTSSPAPQMDVSPSQKPRGRGCLWVRPLRVAGCLDRSPGALWGDRERDRC